MGESPGTGAAEQREPRADIPETCWVLTDPEDIRRFHTYLDDPNDITPKGAALLEMADALVDEREEKRRLARVAR